MLSNFFRKDKTTPLDNQIEAILQEMSAVLVSSPEYRKMLVNLKGLEEIKTKSQRSRINPDTLAIIAGNLLGILLIVAYEQKHVMTSKGFSQILKPK